VHDAPDALDHPHKLSRPAKILLILLVAYAVAVILPDTLRPTALYQLAYYLEGLREAVTGDRPSGPHSVAWGWYPLGTLGFTANNDGKVTFVDDCGGIRPCDMLAWDKLQVGDQIDLRRTAMSDRRAVNQIVFVAHDRPVVLRVAAKANGAPAGEITLMPRAEVLQFFDRSSSLDAWTLLLDQLAGLFFIGLRPSASGGIRRGSPKDYSCTPYGTTRASTSCGMRTFPPSPFAGSTGYRQCFLARVSPAL
jgi:hypothetical protein